MTWTEGATTESRFVGSRDALSIALRKWWWTLWTMYLTCGSCRFWSYMGGLGAYIRYMWQVLFGQGVDDTAIMWFPPPCPDVQFQRILLCDHPLPPPPSIFFINTIHTHPSTMTYTIFTTTVMSIPRNIGSSALLCTLSKFHPNSYSYILVSSLRRLTGNPFINPHRLSPMSALWSCCLKFR